MLLVIYLDIPETFPLYSARFSFRLCIRRHYRKVVTSIKENIRMSYVWDKFTSLLLFFIYSSRCDKCGEID